jgi:hypothetical protein
MALGLIGIAFNGNEYQKIFLEAKRQEREADHSPPTSAEIKRTWIYTSTPPYAFMV